MKVLIFCNRMPDLSGAFFHDVELGKELTKRGHMVVFLSIKIPPQGVNGGTYRGFRFLHYSAASSFLDTSDIWITPHAPALPEVRALNARGYNRPIVATCHYDGNYRTITRNGGTGWSEMLLFINDIMESNYRRNITPWPRQIVRTGVVRPILHTEEIVIPEPFEGDCITLVNANHNKGVIQFLELARRMPDRKFLGVLPYYGELMVPPAPANVQWVPFVDDIREVLKQTRILLMPSFYESYGRIGIEAMVNGIPVIYSRPVKNDAFPYGTTQGMIAWTGDLAIQCDRELPDQWVAAIESLDDEDVYSSLSERCKDHIATLDVFSEGPRLATRIESFSRENPVVIRQSQSTSAQSQKQDARLAVPVMSREPKGPVGFGFSNGRLRIQR
jgi:glycosyltransferase involved in cell wall biosynthesis